MRSSATELRPATWSEVIGQESTVSSIQAKLKTGVSPAWLFYGPTGSGKTTLAEILAREIQGTSADTTFLDIRRINAAADNGVDFVRQLAEETKYHPSYGKYRVIIFDEAHKLTDAAQNALLIPTEPLPGQETTTVWIFCTTEPAKLLPALRGRCSQYELKPFNEKQIFDLVLRAVQAGVQTDKRDDGYANLFIDEVLRIGLTNPREILYSFDKYVSGVPLDEALNPPPESDPVYTNIAKAAVNGNWNQLRAQLVSLKTVDVKGLKSVLCWFFRGALVSSETGLRRSGALAETLIRIGNLSSFEDGVTYSSIVGILYLYCNKVKV